jgi:hypothetical protein
MAQLPESSFEKMTAEAREKERLDRQKMLVSLPRSKVEQEYLAFVAAKVVDLCEAVEDLVLVANEETEAAPEGEAGAGDQGGPGDDGAPAQDVAGSGHGGARLHPEGVQSRAHLRGAGGGGSQAVGEVLQGERSQQVEGGGRFIICIYIRINA